MVLPAGEVVNNRVVKFAADGQFITAWGSAGAGPGQFKGPS